MPKETSAEQTPDTLLAMAETLGEFSSAMRVLAETLRIRNVKQLVVKNEEQRKKGLQYLNSYVGAVRTAMLEEQEVRQMVRGKPAKK